MLRPLSITVAAFLFMVCLVLGGYYSGKTAGKSIVQAKWDADKAESHKRFAETVAAYRTREQQISKEVNEITKEKNRAVNDLQQRVSVLADRVRQFAERPSVPHAAQAAAHGENGRCHCGPVIYREDAEFLGKEAERADQLRISLLACERQYEAAAATD